MKLVKLTFGGADYMVCPANITYISAPIAGDLPADHPGNKFFTVHFVGGEQLDVSFEDDVSGKKLYDQLITQSNR
ncbi:MAG: hypothetical protein HQ556_07095 [Candidatus Marinimicrobia bacterium]|nr:hypothetical protein [Candidatus Neomarinimicrobiota bacterium]